ILASNSPLQNAGVLFDDLKHQANDATMGHAQGLALNEAVLESIVNFELNLATAQQNDRGAGNLTMKGASAGPRALTGQDFYVTINDVLGADVLTHSFDTKSMTLFDGWVGSNNPHRAAIARGEALFNAQRISITGVGGLNDDLGLPVIRG